MQATSHQQEVLKSFFNMPNEDIAQVPRSILRVIDNFELLSKYEIEVVATSAKYCSAGIQQGGKFIFSAMPIILKPEKSSAVPCMRALGVLTPFLNNIADKIVSGIDPNDSIWTTAECLDPGLGNGGLGKVHFSFKVNRIEE